MFWSKLSVEKLDRKGKPVYNNRVSPQGLSTTSGTTSRWVLVNDAWCRLTGLRREQMLGKNNHDLFPKVQADLFQPNDDHVLATGEERINDETIIDAQGRAHSMSARESAYVDQAGKRHVVAILRDLTEHKKLEMMLLQSEKMSAVGRLAGGIAHNFNNLLTVITGFGAFLMQNIPKGDANREDVEEIMKAAERAMALTRQLLSFSRRQVLQPVPLNLNKLLSDTVSMLERLIGEDVQLVMVLSPGLRQVKADPGQLEQVVMNLAVNAKDAMPQGGRITIETADVHFETARAFEHGELPPGRYVTIAVRDTGAGMSREVLSHIFEPFFTTKELGKGTGLGLATVHGIVTQSGGTILVHSEEGRGTSFKVYLPAVDAPAQPSGEPAPAPAVKGGNETILIVDDNVPALTVAQRVLMSKGYRVMSASSPADAIALSLSYQEPIHLLLTDVVMPGMDGVELGDHLTRIRAGIRILYMSGYTEHAALRKDLLAALKSFLQKPFMPEQLCAKVREVLDAKA